MHGGPLEEDADEPGRPGGGWVPPEERAWRHPSELRAGDVAAAVIGVAHGWRRGSAAVVGTTALAAILLGSFLLMSTGSTPVATTGVTLPVGTAAVTPCCTLSPLLARDALEAVVAIEGGARDALETGCGVVVGDGVVVTTIAALDGARRPTVVTATGRAVRAVVVATDRTSGVALVDLATALVAAPLDEAQDVSPGSPALAVAIRLRPRGSGPHPVWTSGRIVSVGRPLARVPGTARPMSSVPAVAPAAPGPTTLPPTSTTTGMAEITVRGSSVPDVQGEPLLDARGQVIGILDAANGDERAFLPMALVAGVSTDLETIGEVRHGWLGVTDTTPADGKGALVLWVDPRGAAASALRPGDVIVGLDGWQVRSSSELRSMLYVTTPGTKVSVQVKRGSRIIQTVLELAASP